MEQMFNVSSNPHVRARMTTAKIMQLVVIALLPAALMGIYNHGLKALAVLVVQQRLQSGYMIILCTKRTL